MSDLTAVNREHFDKVATSHQTDFAPLLQRAIDEFQTRRGWISSKLGEENAPQGDGHQIRLLDYACGAGTASKALISYVDQAVGLDLSEKMVAEYNRWAEGAGLPPTKAHARQLDLLAESDATYELDPELSAFDVATVSMALHHVSDPATLLRRLAKTLRPGGTCVVLDRVPTEDIPDVGSGLPPEKSNVIKTINKHGFTEQEMRKYFEEAGMGKNFEYVVVEEPFGFTLYGQKMQTTGFICRGDVA